MQFVSGKHFSNARRGLELLAQVSSISTDKVRILPFLCNFNIVSQHLTISIKSLISTCVQTTCIVFTSLGKSTTIIIFFLSRFSPKMSSKLGSTETKTCSRVSLVHAAMLQLHLVNSVKCNQSKKVLNV